MRGIHSVQWLTPKPFVVRAIEMSRTTCEDDLRRKSSISHAADSLYVRQKAPDLKQSSQFFYCCQCQVPTICNAGTASLGGSTSCTTCASGTYASVEGSTGCANCPAGSSCSNVTAEPETCTNGTFSQEGSALCTSCDAGRYSFEGASSCLACPVGHSCFDPVQLPVECGDGYYSSGGQVRATSTIRVFFFRRRASLL